MKLSRRAQLLFLAVVTLIIAIASTGWWLSSSPQGVRHTAEAMVILMTGVYAVGRCRRLPRGSPFVLFTTLAGLGATLLMYWR